MNPPLRPEPQTRASALIEVCEWIDLGVGSLLCWLTYSALLYHRHPSTAVMIAVLSIVLCGACCVVAGCRNIDDIAPMILVAWIPAPTILVVLTVYSELPFWFVLSLFLADVIGHLTMLVWVRPPASDPSLASIFGLVSAIRAARTFHPDGTIITGRSWSLQVGQQFEEITQNLSGSVLLRFGPGLNSRFAPQTCSLVNFPNFGLSP